ncbi:hypothetical protein BTW08_15310 [Salinicola sp. MH3R3-1]|uniref:hypothetical protein n=1 Tax=Salinicola sp. MH3R3-1 TaxID=1928762 RepID=UPI00095C93E4|nr:hypothetical protein [Salinicola sp. MH3R3-1]OLO06861.1 hypothetical protein BTW08_15310 [Salinicola sp. MH3R3-1]
MNSQHRRILAAVRAESISRRGPCPTGLVAVALNIASTAGRERLDRHIAELLRTGCLEDKRDPMRGNGLLVTGTGQRELDAPADTALQPSAEAPTEPAGSLSTGADETRPLLAQPVESSAAPTGSIGDADLAAEGWVLMTELATVAFERLRGLHNIDHDLPERVRLHALLRRYQQHTGALLTRYGDES